MKLGTKGDRTRARLTDSMLELIQTAGYCGTGLNAVIDHSATPKGSVYFHFPDGKEGLGVAAIGLAAQQFESLISQAIASSSSFPEAVRAVVEALATIVEDSDYRLGCPVSVVTLEMGAQSEHLREACATAFSSWITQTAAFLEANGLIDSDARMLATVVVSTIEGAIILSRATRSTQPLHMAAEVISELITHRIGNTEETQ